ncbi:glycosyltransferase family 2 protein [Microlunatus sp. Gsoil 973]|uniref:glycosyltransferase family 2 protein n=1 Tax=Microlunatus sp. Gsoil 973 TaxID=2672569 RepID=UPI0012B45435|nr:glycosyltransferase family 2 protein [Microlunatus sp. Gsoil 973]QGN33874.1 glycosyltransferase [Microlunatus sp. Gsoil 973]
MINLAGTDRRLNTIRYAPHTAIASDSLPTVTVVITCYNYARYLPEAVQSVLDQTGVTANVLIVDDASTDDSLAVGRAIAAADARVRVIANEHNLGAVGAFNRGLEEATGEFLVRLDADDLLTSGSLSRAVTVMSTFPDVALVYGHPLHFSGERPPARTTPSWWDVWSGTEWLAARCLDGTNVITSPEVVMRRSVITRVGGMRPLAHTHDMELWLRIAAHADVAYIGGVDQAWHREHSASLSTKAEHPLIILAELRAAFDELFAGLGRDYPNGAELHRSARRAVSMQALVEASRLLDRGRHTDLVEDLASFALRADPKIVRSRHWRHFEASRNRKLPPTLVAAGGTLPRLKRRLREHSRVQRWHRTGVYERLIITNSIPSSRRSDQANPETKVFTS